jgi:hypothetical protein
MRQVFAVKDVANSIRNEFCLTLWAIAAMVAAHPLYNLRFPERDRKSTCSNVTQHSPIGMAFGVDNDTG